MSRGVGGVDNSFRIFLGGEGVMRCFLEAAVAICGSCARPNEVSDKAAAVCTSVIHTHFSVLLGERADKRVALRSSRAALSLPNLCGISSSSCLRFMGLVLLVDMWLSTSGRGILGIYEGEG